MVNQTFEPQDGSLTVTAWKTQQSSDMGQTVNFISGDGVGVWTWIFSELRALVALDLSHQNTDRTA